MLEAVDWFLPSITLQPSLLSSDIQLAILGKNQVGSEQGSYYHLQAKLSLTGIDASLADDLTERGQTDIGLDPSSFLPSVLSYAVHPDNGESTSIPIEVRFSDYHAVDGVQIPFRIQRYVNGSLQLDIAVSSAQIS